jgi:hypothetical protein
MTTLDWHNTTTSYTFARSGLLCVVQRVDEHTWQAEVRTRWLHSITSYNNADDAMAWCERKARQRAVAADLETESARGLLRGLGMEV